MKQSNYLDFWVSFAQNRNYWTTCFASYGALLTQYGVDINDSKLSRLFLIKRIKSDTIWICLNYFNERLSKRVLHPPMELLCFERNL
jgi:hypothetical protein